MGGKSIFDLIFDIFDAGSEPGKEKYIHVC